MMKLKELKEEFPREAISWRAQTLTKSGDKALALAYIDARDVMDRLDEVCGAENWQDRYEVHGPKTICYISVKIGDGWVTKADGAGDTAVEAEKGSLSDSFKRAAVKWGIGRYLYDLPATWVPCETYESGGKIRWSRWKEDPWNYVKQVPNDGFTNPDQKRLTKAKAKDLYKRMSVDLKSCQHAAEIKSLMTSDEMIADLTNLPTDWEDTIRQDARELYKAYETFDNQE